MTVPKTKAPFGLDIDNVTIINFYPQLISISACDLLWLSDNYLLMSMLKVSLSLVYHVITVTYVQFLIIKSIFVWKIVKTTLL